MWGYFPKANISHRFESCKAFFQKNTFKGETLKLNLKVKVAYLGGFLAENEKNKYIIGKKLKSLLYKSVLTFFLGCLDRKLHSNL